jgi:hypothetical protein
MIRLNRDSLVFETAQGEQIPCSAELVTIELIGEAAASLDPEILRNASAAVLHYFREELKRDFVTVAEFSVALERVLKSFGLAVAAHEPPAPSRVFEADLSQIAASGNSCELFFFSNLRQELRKEEARAGQVVRFSGLRRCVKQLVGARRWTRRCQCLNDDIVAFLRSRFETDAPPANRSLIIG